MSNSSLVSYTNLSPHKSTRQGTITKIAPHVTAGTGSAKGTADYFAREATKASSHYIVDGVGDVAQSVDENYRAWTTGGNKTLNGKTGSQIDHMAVTIEVANSVAAHPWPVTDKAYAKLLDLIEDIARRNGMTEVTYKADGTGTLQAHRWYAAKACPGDYLMERFPDIAEKVTARLKGQATTVSTPSVAAETSTGGTVNYTVRKTCSDELNIRSGPGTSNDVVGAITDSVRYTIVEEQNGWGKLKSGIGWISLAYTEKA